MPITLEWDGADRSVVKCTFEGSWTWDEAHAALDRLAAMVADSERVWLIILREQTRLRHEDVVTNLRRVITVLPPHVEMTVIVGASVFATLMIEALGRVGIGPNIRFAESLEEAREMIAARQGRA